MKFMHHNLMALALIISAILSSPVAWSHNGKLNALSSAHPVVGQVAAFGQPGSVGKVNRTIKISLSDAMRFSPSRLTFKQGETVRLRITNAGKIPHEFVLGTKQEIAEHAEMMRRMPEMSHSDASSVQVAPGKTADLVWQFSKAGKFLFACLIPGHREAGMEGSVIVNVTQPQKP